MSKILFILLIGAISLGYSQQAEMPAITITSPDLVLNRVGPYEDQYVLVIDTTKQLKIEPNDTADHSLLGLFYHYITSRLKYPDEVIYQGVIGSLYVGFLIDSTGQIHQVKILKKLHPLLDEMVVQILQECPRFNFKGNDPNFTYIIPVKFRIGD